MEGLINSMNQACTCCHLRTKSVSKTNNSLCLVGFNVLIQMEQWLVQRNGANNG